MEPESKTTPLVDDSLRPSPIGHHFGLVFLYSPWAPELSGTTIPLSGDTFDLGWPALIDSVRRSEITACSFSRRHARFSVERQNESTKCLVTHVSASSGTFVNGHAISTPTVVVPGDLLRLGDAFFAVEADITSFTKPQEPAFWTCPVGTDCVVGHSPAIREKRREIALYGPSGSNRFFRILVQGESGSGKTFVAKALHAASGREGNFLAKNCAETSRDTVDSELFGHIKGAFTGAHRDKPGWFELAAHGTLFLDEVQELPVEVQSKLLKVIDEGVYSPVGAGAPQKTAHVRLICATNRNLKSEAQQGKFREDLLFRIAEKTISVPPLRDRRIDIVEFSRLFVAELAGWGTLRTWPNNVRISPMAMEQLLLYGWPENVRGLQQTIGRMWVERDRDKNPIVLGLDEETRHNLANPVPNGDAHPSESRDAPSLPTPSDITAVRPGPPPSTRRPGVRAPLSRESICTGLQNSAGNVAETARLLGVSTDTLYRRIHDYSIKLTDYR